MSRGTDSDVVLLHAAADPTRLAILRELTSEGSVRACDLTACCTVHQPSVSYHLRVLREAGWVCAERHGTSISFALCADAAEQFRHIAGELRPASERPARAISLRVARTDSRLDHQVGPGRKRRASLSRTRPTA